MVQLPTHFELIETQCNHEDRLLTSTKNTIETFGSIASQYASGMPQSTFLNFLIIYLKSTFAARDGHTYFQKKEVCIGWCIAPVLSDLARLDRILHHWLEPTKVVHVFRYVDDFLIFRATDENNFPTYVGPHPLQILKMYESCRWKDP